MNRLLKIAVCALVCAFGITLAASAQNTVITASNKIYMGGILVPSGTVTFTPVDKNGQAISFSQGGGGLNGPTAFSCAVVSGAITGTCTIPDSELTTPANILYTIVVTASATQQSFTLSSVANITGSTWDLSDYGPPASTTNVQVVQQAYGSGAPPSSCVNPSLYTESSTSTLYQCVAGVFIAISSGGGGGGSGTVASASTGQIAQYPANGTGVGGVTISKDCSLAVGGAITCTKTNGNAFAPSATTDTTNATNIVSGTIAASRLPLFGSSGSGHAPGAVPDPGATAGTTHYLREDGSWDVLPGNTIAALWGFGTSIMYGAGSTNASRLSAFALLASTTVAPAYNNGQSSATASLNVTQIFANYVPDPQNPSAMLFETGENDTNSCGTVPSGCTIDMRNQYSAADAWVAIPNQDRMMASASSATTGTWAYDSTFPTHQPTLTATYGTNEQSSSSGATKTFDIPTGVTAVGLIYGVANSATGTFTITIDGTPVTDNCSSTTTFTSLPCGSVVYTSTTFSFYRQEFTVSSGSTHTLVVTKTNSAKSDIIGVDWNLPAANDGIVYQDAVLSNYAGYSAWNPQAVTVTNQLKADGWNVFYVDLVGGTPGVNTTTDIATSATQVCSASIDTGHPNDCGNLHMFQTIVNKEIASGVAIGNLNNNVGQALVNNGLFQGVINISEGLGGVQNLRSGSNYYSVLNQSHVGGGVLWYNGAGNVFGAGMGQDASSGLPFSGSFANRVFASNIGVWNCDAVYNNVGLDTQADFTDTRCTNVNTGQSYQLGPSMSAYFAPLQGTAIASAATIAPVDGVTHITGTITITTITKPTLCITGVACQISLIADGAWSLGTGGNISVAVTASVNHVITLTYDATTALWYPQQ